jgi:CHAT domain-containing protein
MAQGELGASRPIPAYYSAFNLLRDGNFDRARDGFRNAAAGRMITINGRYADSICYHTMIGECLYFQGNLDQALKSYNDALLVFIANSDWMRRVQFEPNLTVTNRVLANPPTWGPSNRNVRPAQLARSFQVMTGNPNLEQVAQQGGVFAPPELRLIDVPEIIRCTSLALLRRRQILGPVCRIDPLSSRLVVAMEGRIGPVNHWAQAWIDVQKGLALTGVDKFDEALPLLRRAVTLAGQYDHPLTAIALFGLGNIAEQAGDAQAAESFYLEASLSAGYYEQTSLAEESLARLTGLRLAAGIHAPIPQLGAAGAWATRRRFRFMSAVMSRLAAENLAAAGESKAAIGMVDRARKSGGRRLGTAVQLSADLDYVAALANFQNGNSSAGGKLLNAALQRQRVCSPWRFQINMANRLFQANSDVMTARIATNLYSKLLRDPQPSDWEMRPLETMAFSLSPDLGGYYNWLEAAIERREMESVVEISESIRRRRFARYLPLGGRMMSLRWLMAADTDRLTDAEQELRGQFALQYPQFEQLSETVDAALTTMREQPVETDEEQAKTLTAAAKEMASAAKKQEEILGTLALQRKYCPHVFPPQLAMKELQDGLTDKQVMLAFTSSPRGILATMISRQKEASWTIANPRNVRKNVVALLRSIGMHADNSTLTIKQLEQTDWEAISTKLTRQLFDEAQLGFWNRFEEIIIVPDSFLWYLPFEALLVEDDDEQFPLISRMSIRYAPTMSLAVTSSRNKPRHERTVALLGQMFPRDDPETAREEFEQIQTVVDGIDALPDRLPVPTGLLRTAWDRLLVLDDVGDASAGPLRWVPAKVEAAKGDNSLGRWLRLPWGAPEQVLLPGFHSAAESGLKQSKQRADGDDLFAAVTGMMASGTRTVLISRWRTGGQTSYDLMREFLQEAPHAPLAEAWQRSVQVVREQEVDPRREPRISHSSKADPFKAKHPFFWAGYLVVDNGDPVDEQGQRIEPVEPSKAEAGI